MSTVSADDGTREAGSQEPVAGKPNAHFTEDDGPADCLDCDYQFGSQACQKCKALSYFDAACDESMAAAKHSAAPAKVGLSGYAIRVDEFHAFAVAVADGLLTAEQLRPQMPPQIHHAVCALAGEIAASRVPLVAIGPDWELLPPRANYIARDLEILTPPEPCRRPADPSWLRIAGCIGWMLLGMGLAVALAGWLGGS